MPKGVYNHAREDPIPNFMDKWIPEPFSGCWLWTGAITKSGYGRFAINRKSQVASRASWLLFKGNIPDGLFVLHRCDTPACVNPDHLFLGTVRDNNRDCISKGRANPRGGIWQKGEEHHLCKLKTFQVLEIRNDPRKSQDIAKAYGVKPVTVRAIKQKRIWRWLQ